MTTKEETKRFLEQTPDSNEMWLAQTILSNFTDKEVDKMREVLAKLDSIMIKSWAKEMTFGQLLDSMILIESLTKTEKE